MNNLKNVPFSNGVQEAAGSNPVAPTIATKDLGQIKILYFQKLYTLFLIYFWIQSDLLPFVQSRNKMHLRDQETRLSIWVQRRCVSIFIFLGRNVKRKIFVFLIISPPQMLNLCHNHLFYITKI